MNEIGVICLNDIEYQIFLGSFNRDKKIVEYIKKFLIKGRKILLKGTILLLLASIVYNRKFRKQVCGVEENRDRWNRYYRTYC